MRGMSSASSEVDELTWELEYDPEANLAKFSQRSALVVDGIVSYPRAENTRRQPMFNFKHDPEDSWDHAAKWHWDPDREINLDHFVFCGIQWTDEMIKDRPHRCMIPEWKKRGNISG